MSEKTAGFRSMLRTVFRWAVRLAALIVVILIGLAIADSLHPKQCRGGARHKGESYEMMGERLTFLNTGQETSGEVLKIDVTFKPTAQTNPLKWRDVHVHRIHRL